MNTTINTYDAPPSFQPFADAVGKDFPEVTAVIPLDDTDFAAFTETTVLIGCFYSVGFLGFYIEITSTHPLQ